MCHQATGEDFNLTGDKWLVRPGFQWVRWITTIRFVPCCVLGLLHWLVSHPSIAGDGPELAVCNLAFLQRSQPWVSALLPGRTSLGRELCREGGHFNEGVLFVFFLFFLLINLCFLSRKLS